MAWVITKDAFDTGADSAVGQGQWGSESKSASDEPAPKLPLRFRLLTDDREYLYSGRYDAEAVGDEDDGWGGLYQALKWGEWYAGCTILQVRCDEYIVAAQIDAGSRQYVTPDKEGWYIPYG